MLKHLAALVIGLLLLPSRLIAQSPVLGLTTAAAAGTVTASWDPNADGVTTGYIVSYGRATGTYATTLDVGAPPIAIPGLLLNTPYFFAVQAYNTARRLSPYSAEVSVTLADPCAAARVTIAIGDWTLNVKVGDRGVIHFSLAGPLPIVETQVRLGTQVIGGEVGDALITDLRDSAGLYFSVPRTLGPYDLVVATKDNRGCEVVTTLPRTVTVIP